jgi:hypothetical protein
VLRLLILIAAVAALGLGGWLVLGRPSSPPGVAAPRVPARDQAAPPERAPRLPPPQAVAALETPFGDALFRWRCTTGLREALAGHPDWPLRRVAGFCLCVADRMRTDGLREVPPFRGEGLAAALGTAEAELCRPR